MARTKRSQAREHRNISARVRGAGDGGGNPPSDPFPGLGNFTKTLPHNEYGEVDPAAFAALETARNKRRTSANALDAFAAVPRGFDGLPAYPDLKSAPFVNPLAGLAKDALVPNPETFVMPPPPDVRSSGIAAEMTELYWMALLRDRSFDATGSADDTLLATATTELNSVYNGAVGEGTLVRGIDLPDQPFTPQTIFRVGLPGEEVGPLVSQFFVRDIAYGTQLIDARNQPYRKGLNFLTRFPEWLNAQNRGRGVDGSSYPDSNERHPELYLEANRRYVSTMRDLARFVNKDALHQAYFNAALLLLNSGARWTPGNPYVNDSRRDSGFGTLGGPHILALVSEVATRALQTVWFQKWQTYLRLRPEAYAGHLHVQEIGIDTPTQSQSRRQYGVNANNIGPEARMRITEMYGGLLLPMAYTAGSPKHPAYGAGHACVAGACVTVLKAYFRMLDHTGVPLSILSLRNFPTYRTGVDEMMNGRRELIAAGEMTIEGEINKLAMNVAMGRTMGGVHWRSDNTRSLMLGEAIATHMLAKLSTELVEKPEFVFRTFGRISGKPATVKIANGSVSVNGVAKPLDTGGMSLSSLL